MCNHEPTFRGGCSHHTAAVDVRARHAYKLLHFCDRWVTLKQCEIRRLQCCFTSAELTVRLSQLHHNSRQRQTLLRMQNRDAE